MSTSWTTTPDPQTGRYVLPAAYLAGPGIDDLLLIVLEGLADSIHDGDTRADRWVDYLVRRSNELTARDEGADAETRMHLEQATVDAYDALKGEIPRTVRLVLAEARLVAGQLDEAAGTVGIEGRRAA